MFTNKSEAHSRVLEAIDEVKACCEVEDAFYEWDDIAASAITAVIEDLTAEQLDDTCGAFGEYIEDIAKTDSNMAQGIKSALTVALSEMLDFIGDVPEVTAAEVDSESEDSEDGDTDYYGNSEDEQENAAFVSTIKNALEKIESITL